MLTRHYYLATIIEFKTNDRTKIEHNHRKTPGVLDGVSKVTGAYVEVKTLAASGRLLTLLSSDYASNLSSGCPEEDQLNYNNFLDGIQPSHNLIKPAESF